MRSASSVAAGQADGAGDRSAAQARGGVERRRYLRVLTLQWAIGCFCLVVGALMCIVPHQFSSPSFSLIRPSLPWAGGIYLAAGIGLVGAAALQPRHSLVIAAHGVAGSALLFYAFMLLRTGTWSGWPIYLVLGLGTIAAAVLPVYGWPGPRMDGDMFAILIALCAVSNGLVMLLLPGQFQLAIYDRVRPHLLWFGLAFLSSGVLLITAQVRRARLPLLEWSAHALVALAFLCYMALVSVPNRGITGIMFYGGFGILLLLLPWLSQPLAWLDASSLRLRLGLALAALAAVPLTLTVAVITDQEERIALDQALVNQQTLAASMAQDVGNYARLQKSAVAALALQFAGWRVAPQAQREQLQAFQALYPDFDSCGAFDAAGRPLARSDGAPPAGRDSAPIVAEVRRTLRPALALQPAPGSGRPTLAFGAPIPGPGGAQDGVIVCDLNTARLTAHIALPSSTASERVIYVVDEQNRVIAHPDAELMASLTDLASAPPIAALRASGGGAGALRYGESPSARLAGYALVPDLGWGVVVEGAASGALAGVQTAREVAFGVLLAIVGAALVIGIALARRLTAPLYALAGAVERFTKGDATAPLPQTTTTEVAQLATAFGQMREELTTTALAREQAIEMRDMFFSVAAHELRTPLTSLLGQAQLLQRRATRAGTLNPRDQQSLDIVVSQSLRLNKLIGDLLNVSRLQQGRLTLEVALLDLNDVIDRVIDELGPVVASHTLVRSGAATQLPIAGDALRLEQVLQNLIGNAVKYSPAGSEVTIHVSRQGAIACVAVTDRGIGIPQEALPHLFEQFYRAPNADQEHISGLGIGLYVVSEIVSLHGGRVTVESAEGQGSTFTIVLPLARDYSHDRQA